MPKFKIKKSIGTGITAIALLVAGGYLGRMVLKPFKNIKDTIVQTPTTDNDLPPLDLSKIKLSDTQKMLAQRDALAKKAKLEQRALMENDAMAMMEIGLMYEGTELGEADIPQAIYWFNKAAGTGNAQAEKHLSTLNIINRFGNPKETKKNNQTLSLDSSKGLGLGEALAPAVQEMIEETPSPKNGATNESTAEKPSKVMEYLAGKKSVKEMLADTSMSDGEKRFVMSLMSVSKLKKIAKTGNTMAQNLLGVKYYDDEKDIKNALYWFMEAAKGGEDVGITNAAAVLDSGQISESSKNETLAWIRKQADQGRTPAQFVVGKFYKDGRYGFPEDKTIGFAWIEKAAKGGSSEAQMEIGFAKMLGSDVPEDKAGGIKWLRASAKQGNMRGEYWLADAYRDGDFVLQDDGDALMWFERAHNSGHMSAALQMVFIYRDEKSIDQDDDKAREWVEIMIAQNGSSVGYEFAGDMYLEGRGYLQDDRLAFEHYEMAANQDNGTAQYKLAIMHLEGRGTEQNKQSAIEWLKKADKNYSYEAEGKLKQLGITIE